MPDFHFVLAYRNFSLEPSSGTMNHLLPEDFRIMYFRLAKRPLSRIGILGSGNIGPDIALHFAKVLSPEGTRITVVDIALEALEAGRAKVEKKIARGVESGAFKPAQAEVMLDAIDWTQDQNQLAEAELVIEAATEDLPLKRKIFADLETVVSKETILASNSSHLEPERIFDGMTHPQRCLVIHYFFPAERNHLVEIVPGNQTDRSLTDELLYFYQNIGKVPLEVGSRYGYAVDPIFEGLFQSALLAVERGLGSHEQVDQVATRCLGLGIGPFTAMNLTGGTPLTFQGLQGYHEKIMPWYGPPTSMTPQIESGEPWPTPRRGETVEVSETVEEAIRNELQGAFFGIACEVVDSGILSLSDLELAIELGLVMVR